MPIAIFLCVIIALLLLVFLSTLSKTREKHISPVSFLIPYLTFPVSVLLQLDLCIDICSYSYGYHPLLAFTKLNSQNIFPILVVLITIISIAILIMNIYVSLKRIGSFKLLKKSLLVIYAYTSILMLLYNIFLLT